MKKYSFILLAIFTFILSGSCGILTANAKANPIRQYMIEDDFQVYKYRLLKGPVYKNYSLTKTNSKAAKHYKKHTVYSSETITFIRENNKKSVYRLIATHKGKTIGLVSRHNTKRLGKSDWVTGPIHKKTPSKKAPKKATKKATKTAEKNYYTDSEYAQIQQLRKSAQSIGNSTKNMYAQKPQVSGTFMSGKLSDTYIQSTVSWINFFRRMYSRDAIKDSQEWNTEAQYGAAALAAMHHGLSHGLVAFTRPEFISSTNWERAAAATNSSNLAQGSIKPYDVITQYLQDAGNETPGHREWILGGITQVGVGQANDYNDLKVFGAGANDTTPNDMAFPHAGVFPIDVAVNTRWSLSLPDRYPGTGTPSVSVQDETTHQAVPVSHIIANRGGYGDFHTSISYQPAASKVKLNHAYTITITNIPGHADVKYTTKLFNLGV